MIKIRNKIGIAIALLPLIVSSLVGLISLWSSKKIISSEAESKLILTVESYGLEFEAQLQQIHQLALSFEALLAGTAPSLLLSDPQNKIIEYKKKMVPIVEGFLYTHKPMSAWIVFNPALAKGKHTISYEDIDGNGEYQREEEYSVSDFDACDPSMGWWYDAIKYGNIWTKPYYWENWDSELISYSRAVYVEDKFIGCVGSDFSFHKLRQKLQQARIYQNGYMFLLDEKLDFIIHPNFTDKNLSQVIDSVTCKKIIDQFKLDNQGLFYYKLGQLDKVMAFYKLSNGWYIGVTVELKDIFSSTASVLHTILIVILLGIILSILIAFFLSSSLTHPLHQVILQFRKGALGHLNVRAGKSNTLEINELSDHFNSFMVSMQNMVDQLKDSENKLLIAKRKAEESDKLKTAFLENISHEVRTPLNAIIGFSQILVRDNVEKATKENYLKYIDSSSNRLIKIVEDIMLFSQLEKGVLSCKPKQIDLDRLFANIQYEFIEKINFDEKQINFTISKPDTASAKYLSTDILNLKRAFTYLIENAWKFTNEGEISFGYQIGQNNQPIFFVRDTGIGIPLEEQENVLLKFYKYQPLKNKFFDGTGLGLSITKDLVALLGGKLWLVSDINQGTTVFFTINEDQSEIDLSQK